MKKKQIVMLGTVLVLLLTCVLGWFLFTRTHGEELKKVDKNKKVSTGEAWKDFDNYTYLDQHDNGSYQTISIYRHDDKYYLMQMYQDVGGSFMYKANALSDKEATRFENSVASFKTVVKSGNDGIQAYIRFLKDDSDVLYKVVPIDIAGYGAVDPWAESENITLSSNVEGNYAKIFPIEDIKGLLNMPTDAQLGAYTQMLGIQIVDTLSTKKDVVALSDVSKIKMKEQSDNGYTLTVIYSNGKESVEKDITFTRIGNVINK